MVSWRNLCASPGSNRLNPALQQYYAEETEEFFTNLANGLDNLVVTLGSDSVRLEWLELAVSFLRTTHSEVQVLLDKLKHYSSLGSKSDPDWLDTYMEETTKLLDACTRLKPGLVRIDRYQLCVELASRALSKLNLDDIQAELRRCLHRGDGAAAKTGPDDVQALDSEIRKWSPPSRESFEFPVSGFPAMETSPVMPSSPSTAIDACRKADKLIQSIERMSLSSPGKGGDGRIDALARDALSLRSQFLVFDGGDESFDSGVEDLESLVAEAEKLLYIRRPGSLTEPPPPPPGMFDGPAAFPRDIGSPLRPFKLDANFKIDISPSKSSDSSSSPHSSRRRSSEGKTGTPRKPPVYPHSDRGALELAKDTNSRLVSGEAEPGSSNKGVQGQASADIELGSTQNSTVVSLESTCSGVVASEQISAPLICQFEDSLNALRECKEAISREWRSSAESQKLIVDPMQSLTSRTGLSGSFTKYFKHRTSFESSRRKSSGEGSKLAQFLETLTADRDSEEDEAKERWGALDGLNTISPSAWVEKGVSPMREGKAGQGKEQPKAPSTQGAKDAKHLPSSNRKMLVPSADAKLPQSRELPLVRNDTTNQAASTAPVDQSRRGLFYGGGNLSRVPTMEGTHQKKVQEPSSEAKPSRTTGHASVSLSMTKGPRAKQTSLRRRSQSLDEIGMERIHWDLLDMDSPERTPSPKASQDLTSPQGQEAAGNSRRSGGAHRRSASFDRLKPYSKGGWRSERTEAIIRAYQNRRKALPPSPEPTVEILPSEDGTMGLVAAREVEESVDRSEGTSLVKKYPAGTSNLFGAPSRRGLEEPQAGIGAPVGHGGARTSRTTDSKLEKGMPGPLSGNFDTTAEQPRTTQPSSLPEAKHLKPLGLRAGVQNVASIVAKFESFFDAEFETKHDIKTAAAGGQGSKDWSTEFEAKMRVYDNPLHRAPPAAIPAAAPVKGRRPSPSRLWRIGAAPSDSSFWQRNASPSPSKEQGSKGSTRLVSSVSPVKRDRPGARSTSSSPGRLSLFGQVRQWVNHHQGLHPEDRTHEAGRPGSNDLRRSRSSTLPKPTTPSHALMKSPGRLSMNLVTIQKGATSLVKNFGQVAMKQCSNPTGGSSKWSGLGGVFLATRASTGVVSSFLLWVLARSEGAHHPSRLDYAIAKSEFHWAVSLQKLQEKVGKFDKGQSARTSADARTSFMLGLPDADGKRASSSSETDRKGRKRWSLELKRRRPSSEHRRQDVEERRPSTDVVLSPTGLERSNTNRPSTQEDSAIPEQNPCLHIQDLRDVHECVEELHAGLESLLSSCLSALGKNHAELEQLPQEKIIRECVPSESPESGMRRRLFDKLQQGDAHVPARPIQAESRSSIAQQVRKQMSKGREKPEEEPGSSSDSHRLSNRTKYALTTSHHVSYSGSSFSFELDNGVDEQLKHVESIFGEWRSGKMAKTMRKLKHYTEELRASLETVSKEVDELFRELETGRRAMMD